MPPGSLVPWNKIITTYAKGGHCREALQSFRKMCRAGAEPDKITFVSVLKACADSAVVVEGRLVHACIADGVFESELFVGNALINMYGKCGSIQDAFETFGKISKPDVVSWTTMITTYARHDCSTEALQLFQSMCQAGGNPNNITFITILNTCNSPSALADGKSIHALLINNTIDSDVVVVNCLISMYNRCESLDDAQRVFDTMDTRNVVSWNTMIAALAQQGQPEEAFRVFQKMREEGVQADKITFVSILKGVGPPDLAEGEKIHADIMKNEIESDVVVGTALVNMYGKCGRLEDARVLFGKLSKRNIISWTAMITVYAMHGLGEKALQLFQKMLQDGIKPDRVTFVEILEACASPAALKEGKLIHRHIKYMGFELDVVVGTALISMYGKCGSVEDAKALFIKMAKRNIITWTVMIAAYAQHGCGKDAFQHFLQMQEEGLKPNKVTFLSILDACASPAVLVEGKWIHALIAENGMESDVAVGNALVNMYGKCGSLEDARVMFARMPQHDVVSWTAILYAHAQQAEGKLAFQLFQQMHREGVKPDKVTFISILDVCGNFPALGLGKLIHAYIIDSGFELEYVVGSALLNMYNKCGTLRDAQWVFNKISNRGLILWSAMIGAYAQHGLGEKALKLFQQMKQEEVKPDEITFISLLSACSHAGLVDDGFDYFGLMSRNYSISPTLEHYLCIVDLLCRVGLLDKAESFINRMPFQPTVVMWMTLLAACRIHDNIEHGKRAAEHVLELDSCDPAAYVVLSNMYAAAGKWDDMEKVRAAMIEKGVKKVQQCSMIEMNDQVHTFVVRDISHLQTEEIYVELDRCHVPYSLKHEFNAERLKAAT